MANVEEIMDWTFYSETNIPKDVQDILVPGEDVEIAYKTIRDIALITNKRLIISDKQGLTGKKTEIYSIPYRSIIMYSSENAGMLDFNAEIQLWTRAGNFKLNLKKGVDIRKLDKIIGKHIL